VRIAMKIIIKVPGESQQLVDSLGSKDVEAKIIRGGVLVSPPRKSGAGGYVIPEEVLKRKFIVLIDCHEEGGAMTNTGSATIVCSFRGKLLKPYYRPTKGHLSNGIHAYFSVPNAVVTITARSYDSDISIVMHRAIVKNGIIDIEGKELWSGEFEFLPKKFECYRDAIDAVVAKSNCYHCRRAYYVA